MDRDDIRALNFFVPILNLEAAFAMYYSIDLILLVLNGAALSVFLSRPARHTLLLIVNSIYLTIGIIGFCFYSYGIDLINVPFYRIFARSSDFNSMSLFLYLSALLVLNITSAAIELLLPKLRSSKNSVARVRGMRFISIKKSTYSLAIVLMFYTIYVSGRGLENTLFGGAYLAQDNRALTLIGTVGILPSAFICGWCVSGSRRVGIKIISVIIGLLFWATLAGLATRLSALFWVMFVGGHIYGKGSLRRSKALIFILVLMLPSLLSIPLYMRGSADLGLLNLPESLLSYISLRSFAFTWWFSVISTVENFTFGLPLAGMVYSYAKIPDIYFWTEINPLPSFIGFPGLPDWYTIAPTLTIPDYAFIPYNGIGELANYGFIFFCSYYILASVVITFFDRKKRYFSGSADGAFGAGVVNLCSVLIALSFLLSTQYVLRASTRFFYYAIFIYIIYRMGGRLVRMFVRSTGGSLRGR
ncbi:hypothetical protein [Salinisphaera hydrothermalis]|uniref:hypothetical protein n=1 Tax=Salinisphaera hydrothermalis TaxID=563188 RepID=UPI0012EBABF1|nr:hypothetical protein [Salinisphaera hydrothermalis]